MWVCDDLEQTLTLFLYRLSIATDVTIDLKVALNVRQCHCMWSFINTYMAMNHHLFNKNEFASATHSFRNLLWLLTIFWGWPCIDYLFHLKIIKQNASETVHHVECMNYEC